MAFGVKRRVARTTYTGIAAAVMKSDAFTMEDPDANAVVVVWMALAFAMAGFVVGGKDDAASIILRMEAQAWASRYRAKAGVSTRHRPSPFCLLLRSSSASAMDVPAHQVP